MPTESAFFFAGLLFLAAALGYVFARFGEIDDDEEARESTRADFLKGFRYLLNEEPDRAVDVFTGVERIGAEGLDTQLALGALFRRQGELDRALRLHQHILERPGLSDGQREQAGFALAEDYLSAGLFDRAEELLGRLRGSGRYRDEAGRRLLRIAELSSDWAKAVELGEELTRTMPEAVPPSQLAHYHCELAEEAMRDKDWAGAGRQLSLADAVAPDQPRNLLLRADVQRAQGRDDEAVALYRRLAHAAPELIGELVPRLAAMTTAPGRERAVTLLGELAGGSPEALQAVAVALIREPAIRSPAVLAYLERFVSGHPVLRDLTRPDDLRTEQPAEREQDLDRIRGALQKIAAGNPRYQCGNCGYASLSLQWQCPGCRSWGTVRPVNQLFPGRSPA